MIHVDRSTVKEPEILRSELSVKARQAAIDFFSLPIRQRAQERFMFESRIWQGTRNDLYRLFKGKCAYCESELAPNDPVEFDRFRPKSQPVGMESDQEVDQYVDGYWWLAYEWENLYMACTVCNRNKRNRFSVIGRRAQWHLHKETDLRKERALLIDPCWD